MKTIKTITTALLLLFTVTAFSQTKEETVEYISDIVKISKGSFNIGIDCEALEQTFSFNNCSMKQRCINSHNNVEYAYISDTDIPWETLNEVLIRDVGSKELKQIRLKFGAKVKYTYNNEESELVNTMTMYVISEKAPNVQKAFLHLKELMQADDPFATD